MWVSHLDMQFYVVILTQVNIKLQKCIRPVVLIFIIVSIFRTER